MNDKTNMFAGANGSRFEVRGFACEAFGLIAKRTPRRDRIPDSGGVGGRQAIISRLCRKQSTLYLTSSTSQISCRVP